MPIPPAQRYAFMAALAAGALAVVAVLVLTRGDNGADTNGSGGLTGGDFHSLVVDPGNPSRIFVGGHQAVSVSVDGGSTWNEVKALRNADAMGWAFADGAIYVSGHPGLNRSDDGGETFTRINDGLPNTDVHALGGTGQTLYGSTPATGVFTSTDAAAGWRTSATSAGQSYFGRIVVDPTDTQHLFAADAATGVVESADGGTSWQLLDTGLPMATWLSAGGDDLEILVASGPEGAARSADGGRTWQTLQLPEGATLAELVPSAPDTILAGIHSGNRVQVQVSHDRGITWAAP